MNSKIRVGSRHWQPYPALKLRQFTRVVYRKCLQQEARLCKLRPEEPVSMCFGVRAVLDLRSSGER